MNGTDRKYDRQFTEADEIEMNAGGFVATDRFVVCCEESGCDGSRTYHIEEDPEVFGCPKCGAVQYL